MLFQFKTLLILCLTGLLSLAAPVNAQTGFPDILEDIFKGGQNQAPYGTNPGGVYIENIPVQITFDTRPDLLPSEASLIVTAVAPPPPNIRRASPLIMGETRILISRLVPPLSLVVAVPSDMARDLDYASISARIVDANGNVVQQTREPQEYSGGQPPFLSLIPAGAIAGPTPVMTDPNAPNPPFIPSNVMAVKGKVSLIQQRPIMRGSTLVMRVTENGLVGGHAQNIVTEERIDIDGKQAPLDYEIFVPAGPDNTLESPEIEVWIEDWAGRKTHITRTPLAFTPASSADTMVNIRLDTLLTGAEAVPPNTSYIAPAGVNRDISGEAKFNAFKGLPRGSVLVVSLQDGTRLDEIIKDVTVPLDGLSGNIPFNMQVERQRLDGRRSDPLLSAKINDNRGRTLLLSHTLVTLQDGFMTIELHPTGLY